MASAGGGAPPDWSRFGLETPDEGGRKATEATPLHEEAASYGGHRDLYSEEKGNSAPWWTSRQFFVRERLLFGRWDGVFTSCLVNLLGVIVFLRAGWIIGQAGVVMAVLMVLLAVLVVLTSVLSAVGISERSTACPLPGEDKSCGGVYYLIAHVLGGQVGGAIGLVYCFGQTVGITLCVAGFAESISELFSLPHALLWQRLIAGVALLMLALINIAGVKWVVKVQFLLLVIILLGVVDFLLGSVLPNKHGSVPHHWSREVLLNNTASSYTPGHSWFTVMGVFFPAVTGVMAGINMSGDLRSPATDVPIGTLSALGFSTAVYLLVMVVLGATVQRSVLLTDFMITEKTSAVGALLMLGVYTSTLSSSVGSLYGTPRVLQSIAAEGVVPVLTGLSKGKGPNQVPVYGVCVVTIAACLCLLLGNINTLAPIVSTPFLLTYAALDYAYFVLAATADSRPTRDYSSYTGAHKVPVGGGGGVLDTLFPERVTHHKKIITSTASSETSSVATSPDGSLVGHVDDLTRGGGGPVASLGSGIAAKAPHWYSRLCNRWTALVGAGLKLALMLAINWLYGVITLAITAAVYLYVGHAAPGLPPGLASDFSFVRWLKFTLLRCMGRAPIEADLLVVAPLHPGVQVEASQLTEDNEDFAARSRYHASEGGNTMPAPP